MTERAEMEAVIEAVLFVASEPVPRSRLIELFDDDEREEAAAALETVLARYGGARGFRAGSVGLGAALDLAGADPGLAAALEADVEGGDEAALEGTGGEIKPAAASELQVDPQIEPAIEPGVGLSLDEEPEPAPPSDREPTAAADLEAPAVTAVEQHAAIERNALAERQAEWRGIMVEEVAGGVRLVTRPELVGWLRRFFDVSGGSKLSMAALETLAIIAYRQPMTAPEIQELRSVSPAGVLKTLLERRLVRIAGRKEVVGKPFLYATTREFLIHFGLKSLKDLPPLEEFEETFGGMAQAAGGELLAETGDREEQILREAAALEEAAARSTREDIEPAAELTDEALGEAALMAADGGEGEE